MAFVSRAERSLDFGTSKFTSVGPGAYGGHTEKKKTKAYAPFSSTTQREVHKPINQVTSPGPGSYSNYELQTNSISAVSQSKDPYAESKSYGPFASKSKRFKESKAEQKPGPGSYNLPVNWPKKAKTKKRKDWNTVNWMRIPSAPSIPARNQVFGYRETNTGELVMEKNPEVVYDGTGSNTVGPGHYNAQYPGSYYSKKGTEWHKSTSKRELFGKVDTNKNLGPGSYQETPTTPVPIYKSKPSAAFASGIKRESYIPEHGKSVPEEEETSEEESYAVPGPGYYFENGYSSFATKKPPRHLQYFGSRSLRFQSKTPDTKVGPGYYSSESSSIGNRKPGDSRAPFSSTNIRFQQKLDTNPGPGSYNDPNLVERLSKKTKARQGVFGSTEKRFAVRVEEETPGPGYYPPDAASRLGMHNFTSHKPSSVFLSKAKREISGVKKEGPAPGSYEVPSPIGNKKPPAAPIHPVLAQINPESRKPVAFASKAQRFTYKQEPDDLGPGYYDLRDSTKNQSHSTMARVFINKSERFSSKPKELPGPGSYYEEHNEQSWVKRSFNLLFRGDA